MIIGGVVGGAIITGLTYLLLVRKKRQMVLINI
jgi:formate/nitrite transporter FocA (FNT family)